MWPNRSEQPLLPTRCIPIPNQLVKLNGSSYHLVASAAATPSRAMYLCTLLPLIGLLAALVLAPGRKEPSPNIPYRQGCRHKNNQTTEWLLGKCDYQEYWTCELRFKQCFFQCPHFLQEPDALASQARYCPQHALVMLC
jgi:hypothetical protein